MGSDSHYAAYDADLWERSAALLPSPEDAENFRDPASALNSASRPSAASDYRQQAVGRSSTLIVMTASSEASPRRVLERMYQAEAEYLAAGGPGTASFTTLAPFFDPDVRLWQADTLPYGGVWRGHDGIERFFLAMSATWDRFEMTEQAFLSAADPLVVLTHVNARSRNSGRELSFPILQTITVTEGLITEVRPFYWDTAAIVDACSGR